MASRSKGPFTEICKLDAVLTFGHGNATQDQLAALIRGAEIERVVDVRSVPKSRAHPHVWEERLAVWIPAEAGAAYEWQRDLGGFRRTTPESPNIALRHPSFRGYADYMQTPQFANALDELVRTSKTRDTAIMCSETLWWRCHRRLIADALVLLRGIDVSHLMHDGRLDAHKPTAGVRRDGDLLVYDVPTEESG